MRRGGWVPPARGNPFWDGYLLSEVGPPGIAGVVSMEKNVSSQHVGNAPKGRVHAGVAKHVQLCQENVLSLEHS